MAKGVYIGVNNVARKVKKMYIGVDGKARKIKKGYIGVGGVARPFFSGGELVYYGTATPFNTKRQDFGTTTVGNYAIFAGGNAYYANANAYYPSNEIIAYNQSLVKTTAGNMKYYHTGMIGVTLGNYAIFTGGTTFSNYFSDYGSSGFDVEVYNSALVRCTPNNLNITVGPYRFAATSVGNYALFAGGQSDYTNYISDINSINSSLVFTGKAARLSDSAMDLAATTVGNYALFAGGYNPGSGSNNLSYVDAYTNNLVKTSTIGLSKPRREMAATTINGYALFAGGRGDTIIDVFTTTLTRLSCSPLSEFTVSSDATSIGDEYAIFANNEYSVQWPTYSVNVEIYDKSLIKQPVMQTSVAHARGGITSVGNYVLIAAGLLDGNTKTDIVDVFTIA